METKLVLLVASYFLIQFCWMKRDDVVVGATRPQRTKVDL